MQIEPDCLCNLDVYFREVQRLEIRCARLELILAGRQQKKTESSVLVRRDRLLLTTTWFGEGNNHGWKNGPGGVQPDANPSACLVRLPTVPSAHPQPNGK